MRDWVAWHAAYDDPGSALSERLRWVRGHLLEALHGQPPGPIRLVSACAGQGRDTVPVLAADPRGGQVRARLVETDPVNAAIARDAARDAGLVGVEVLEADAGAAASYAGAVPAGIVQFCGVFGNISDADIERTVRALPQLCAPGATVIWTRGRRQPDVLPAIREWFRDSGFELVAFESSPRHPASVGVHRFVGEPVPLDPGRRFFDFAGLSP
jgi:hypothetical protein